jgi:hypothetical protein
MRTRLLLVTMLSGWPLACGSEREPAEVERVASTQRQEPEMRAIAGGLTWDAQAPFVYRAPGNAMRAAEYEVRGHADAVLAVFFFGEEQGGGGSVRSNIDRWLAQFEQPDGRPTAEVATIEERQVNGMRVTTVDARGTFVGRLGIGEAGNTSRPGWRVLGAIAEGPRGLVFFKLTGPEAAVGAAEVAFEHLVDSLEPI